jgi:mono/diheme cytochrome c family protein
MMKGTSQILRQVAVIIVILAIWSGLFVGYLALTKPGEEASPATPAIPENAQVSFSDDVLPILQARCQRCHGPGPSEVGLRLDSYEDVLAGSSNGPVVVPSSADTSYLVDLIRSGSMPFGAAKLPDAEIQTIVDWVNAGAPDN